VQLLPDPVALGAQAPQLLLIRCTHMFSTHILEAKLFLARLQHKLCFKKIALGAHAPQLLLVRRK
jgi:hypothetical protein